VSLAASSPPDGDAGVVVSRQKGDRLLLLVTVLLVVAGLVLLVVGFEQSSLGLVYTSIGCTAVAGVTLTVFSRVSRRVAIQLAIQRDSPHWPEPASAMEEPATDEPDRDGGPEPEPPGLGDDWRHPDDDQVPSDDA
jgi:hypothetical protein